MELQKKLMNFGGKQVIVFVKPEAEPEVSLSDMTKSELIVLAEERNLEVSSRMTKAKIIEALEAADV